MVLIRSIINDLCIELYSHVLKGLFVEAINFSLYALKSIFLNLHQFLIDFDSCSKLLMVNHRFQAVFKLVYTEDWL